MLCPRCKTCRWLEGSINRMICPFCTATWYYGEDAKVCPVCGKIPTFEGQTRLNCARCEYSWVPMPGRSTSKCPLCGTKSWREGSAITHICSVCGHSWRNKVRSPKRCPSCYSELWNVPCCRLQCKRCGHRWITRGGSSKDVRICPKCKSKKWMEPPILKQCVSCGSLFATVHANKKVCEHCRGFESSHPIKCEFCGTAWRSPTRTALCPKCGAQCSVTPKEKSTTVLWSRGEEAVTLEIESDAPVIYCLRAGIPLAAAYLPDVISLLGISTEDLINRHEDDRVAAKLGYLADTMYANRNAYLNNMPRLADLLGLGDFDAKVLAIHFTGMSPESIALSFGKTYAFIRESFDRIMEAYQRTGIVVNDRVFTEDPFAEYRKQMSS